MNYSIQKISQVKGEVTIPGDKSISHRSIMFGSIATGRTEVTNFLQGADCLSTIACFQKLGIEIQNTHDRICIDGKGLHGLSPSTTALDAGNSGTTTRLIAGILSGQSFETTLTGDASIQKRPMKRIIQPLTQMGASIKSLQGNDCAPLRITGNPLHGISYTSPVASAQVKSALLLAGLYAEGETSVTEPYVSRNHSELMLASFGASLSTNHTTVTIQPAPALEGQSIVVPGDISSAAYFIAAALLCPNSELLIKNVGINPTRDGILRVVSKMGGNLTILNERVAGGEPCADLLVSSSTLQGITIGGELIPTLIDELPIIAVMAAFAQGTTVIKDASELKVKESDRITIMAENLTAMGACVEPTEDGMIIHGATTLHGANIDSHLDHRIAMSFAIAGICAEGETTIQHADCVSISYPSFFHDLQKLNTYRAN